MHFPEPVDGIPELIVRTPDVIRERYAEWRWTEWQRIPEVVVYRLTHPVHDSVFLKMAAPGWYPSPEDEAARMIWAGSHLPVPEVLESGREDEAIWVVTSAMDGMDATKVNMDATATVTTLAHALRTFHEAPVADCPFDFQLDRALDLVEERARGGLIVAERDFHAEHQHLSVEGALGALRRMRPASEDVVVCHGDYCFPNILLHDGELIGFVDVGEMGVADRWWDLAVATWSATWNVGPGFESLFLETYGIEPDPERTAFYRLLYDCVS